MVSPTIQQVTTRSKTKQSEWEVQEAVWKAAKEWVEEANKNNASRMLQEMEEQNVQKSVTQINLLQKRKLTIPGKFLQIAKFPYLWHDYYS